MAKNQHVVPHCGKWAVKRDGSDRPSRVVGTQQEAIDVARQFARNQGVDVVIHGRNGQIRNLDVYGRSWPRPRDLD